MGVEDYEAWDPTGDLSVLARRLPDRKATADDWREVERIYKQARRQKRVREIGVLLGRMFGAFIDRAKEG